MNESNILVGRLFGTHKGTQLSPLEMGSILDQLEEGANFLQDLEVHLTNANRVSMFVRDEKSGKSVEKVFPWTIVEAPFTVTDEFLSGGSTYLTPQNIASMVESTIVEQLSHDFVELLLLGDLDSEDRLLKAHDGFLKQAKRQRIITWKKRDLTIADVDKFRDKARLETDYTALLGPDTFLKAYPKHYKVMMYPHMPEGKAFLYQEGALQLFFREGEVNTYEIFSELAQKVDLTLTFTIAIPYENSAVLLQTIAVKDLVKETLNSWKNRFLDIFKRKS